MRAALCRSDGICETLFAERLWDSICKASARTNHADKCQNNVSGHPWEKIIKILVRSWVDDICGTSIGKHLSDIHMWKSVQMTSMGNYLEDTCGKLSVGRGKVCETLFAGRLWDSICKASVRTSQTDKCQNNVSGHPWERIIEVLVRSWVDDICGKSIAEHPSDISMWKPVQMTSMENYLRARVGSYL